MGRAGKNERGLAELFNVAQALEKRVVVDRANIDRVVTEADIVTTGDAHGFSSFFAILVDKGLGHTSAQKHDFVKPKALSFFRPNDTLIRDQRLDLGMKDPGVRTANI